MQLEGRVHPDAAVALDACPVVGAQPGRAPAHTTWAALSICRIMCSLLSGPQPCPSRQALPINEVTRYFKESQGRLHSLKSSTAGRQRCSRCLNGHSPEARLLLLLMTCGGGRVHG